MSLAFPRVLGTVLFSFILGLAVMKMADNKLIDNKKEEGAALPLEVQSLSIKDKSELTDLRELRRVYLKEVMEDIDLTIVRLRIFQTMIPQKDDLFLEKDDQVAEQVLFLHTAAEQALEQLKGVKASVQEGDWRKVLSSRKLAGEQLSAMEKKIKFFRQQLERKIKKSSPQKKDAPSPEGKPLSV